MARRSNGKRFLGNESAMEIHDLDNERSECEIDAIIAAGADVYFDPDSLAQAHSEGYVNGCDCIYRVER